MGDLTVSYKKPHGNKKYCEMCGIKPKDGVLVVVMDPNIFPDNEEEDTWDVCTDCRDFINSGTGMSFEIGVRTAMGEDPVKVAKEVSVKHGFAPKKGD